MLEKSEMRYCSSHPAIRKELPAFTRRITAETSDSNIVDGRRARVLELPANFLRQGERRSLMRTVAIDSSDIPVAQEGAERYFYVDRRNRSYVPRSELGERRWQELRWFDRLHANDYPGQANSILTVVIYPRVGTLIVHRDTRPLAIRHYLETQVKAIPPRLSLISRIEVPRIEILITPPPYVVMLQDHSKSPCVWGTQPVG